MQKLNLLSIYVKTGCISSKKKKLNSIFGNQWTLNEGMRTKSEEEWCAAAPLSGCNLF
jgi:hypothetical protein